MNKGLDLIKRQQPEIIDGFPTGNIFIGVTKEELTELENELKEYEQHKDIEEELGIDLLTLFKALKDGYWVKEDDGIYHIASSKGHYYRHQLYKNIQEWSIFSEDVYENTTDISLVSYGKTWALTKEELEK